MIYVVNFAVYLAKKTWNKNVNNFEAYEEICDKSKENIKSKCKKKDGKS